MSFLFVPTPQLVAKEDALPGRAEPILEPKPHAVLGTPITGPWKEGQRSLLVALGRSRSMARRCSIQRVTRWVTFLPGSAHASCAWKYLTAQLSLVQR